MERLRTTERLVRADGVDLCVQVIGDPTDPALLLIGGAAASMDWWETEFCERLAAGGRLVIRYDHRDTGRSTAWPAGAPGYTGSDLVADAAALLDALGIARAHVVGISMGGGIAQHLVLAHPERVASLVLMSTSPVGPGGAANPDLPPMAAELEAVFAEPAPAPDWSDREAVIAHIVDGERPFRRSQPFDEAGLRALAGRVVDRTNDIAASMTNHWLLDPGEPVRSRLGEITAPTLVLHGTEDPLLPYGHGVALAEEIRGARLVPLPGVGHELPRPAWDVAVPAILEHTG